MRLLVLLLFKCAKSKIVRLHGKSIGSGRLGFDQVIFNFQTPHPIIPSCHLLHSLSITIRNTRHKNMGDDLLTIANAVS